jgi:hypothetical protein
VFSWVLSFLGQQKVGVLGFIRVFFTCVVFSCFLFGVFLFFACLVFLSFSWISDFFCVILDFFLWTVWEQLSGGSVWFNYGGF